MIIVSVTASTAATRTFTASTTAQSKFTISKNKILNHIGTRISTASAQSRRITFERTTTGTINMILNRVSNINSKNKFKNSIKISKIIKISFRLAKNKRKKSNHPVTKIQKKYLSSMREY